MARSIHHCALAAALLCVCTAAAACDKKAPDASTTTSESAVETTPTATPDDDEGQTVEAETPEGDDAVTPAAGIDMGATLDRLAERLPADTMAVVVVDMDRVLDSDILSALGANLSDTQRKAFRKDIGDYLKQKLGVDPSGVEWFALAIGAGQWIAAITPGPLTLADGLPAVEAGTVKGTRLKIDDASVFDLGDGWQAVLPDHHMAAALVPAPKNTLAGADTWKAMKRVSGEVGDGVVAVVDLSNPLVKAAAARDLPRELLGFDAMALSLGGGLAAAATGTPEAVEGLQNLFGQFETEGRKTIDALYGRRDALDMGQGLLAIAGHHLYAPLIASSQPTYGDDLVKLDLRGDDAKLIVGLVGVTAAIAVPTFQKYITDSKTSEAELNLMSLGDGALTYYQEEHVTDPSAVAVVTRVYPLAVDPVCTEAFDRAGGKLSPDATDWSTGPWRDLRFELSRPHYFQYCYQSSADQKSFAAWAEAALDGDGTADTRLCLRGASSDLGPELGFIEDVGPGAPCAP